jgi:Fe-S-cluster containining protein
MDYLEEINLSEQKKAELDKLFNKIKKKRPKHLDRVFHTAHDKAFEEIDCLKCANCCKTTSPIFRDVDIQRISKKFKMTTLSFETQYLRKDSEDDWVLKEVPCTFLQEDNGCFIYDVRPQACREYPHTDRKRMIGILDITRKNAEICPAVSKVVDDVQKEFS